jgi:membrane-associated phospholipid phosphatase
MSRQALLIFSVAAAALCVLGILWLDQPLSQWIHRSGGETLGLFDVGIAWLDTLSGKNVSKFLPGALLLLPALALLARKTHRRVGFALLYVAAVQLLASLACGMAKNVFGRLRPLEVLQAAPADALWFAGGNSFPSGHMAFYLGLFLPFAVLLPRWRWPLLIVPAFVAVARVGANDHFLGDVAASAAITALLAAGLAWGLRRQLPLPARSAGRADAPVLRLG